MFVDYYAILEISPSATKAELRSAYKRQAIKWHPDKNPGKDTTQKMQEINAAYIFLYDDEARKRYDKEYPRFKNFEQAKKAKSNQNQYEQKKHESPREEKGTNDQTSDKKEKKSKEENFSFQFDDEILKKWMENARKQAIRNVHEMITEFRDSSVVGFGTFFNTALKTIGVAVIFYIIFLIISLLNK